MKKILKMFNNLFKCGHRFRIGDVLDIRIDPLCVKCGCKLSEWKTK